MGTTMGVGIFFLVLIIIIQSIVGSYFSSKKIKFFHETEVAILLGIILSAVSYFGFNYTVTLDKSVFIFIFLPAIIFSEGYSMKKRHVVQNLPYILTYGLLGTIITFLVVLLLLYIIVTADHKTLQISVESEKEGERNFEYIDLSMRDLTLLSAALSSKDSFLASTMIDHHSYPFLFHVIFAEGIINDATSLILFGSFDQLVDDKVEVLEWNMAPSVLWIMFKSISISIVAGVLSGVICSLILKHFQFLNKTVVHEILIIFMCSYGSYCIVESFHFSGVLSLLFSGFIIGHYAFYNLSDKGKLCSNITFQTLSSGAENFLFAYLGFTTFSFYRNAWSLQLIGYLILFLILARFISVFVITAIIRFFLRGAFAINLREQFVLQLTGISRGILGYILMDSVDFKENSDVLNSSMLGVLVITTLFFGLINPKLIDLLLPEQHHHHNHHHESPQSNGNQNKNNNQNPSNLHKNDIEQSHNEEKCDVQQNIEIKRERVAGLHKKYDKQKFPSKITYLIQRLNAKYIKPFLIRNYYENFNEIVICKELFKEDKFEMMRPDNHNKNFCLVQQSIQSIADQLRVSNISKKYNIVNSQNIEEIDTEQQKQIDFEDKLTYDEDEYLDRINQLQIIKQSFNKERKN